MDKEDIIEELDELAVQLLVLSQNLVNVKLMLEQTMKEGFIGLAQSRKNMSGPTSVSSLQLPTEEWEPFEADMKVHKSECVRQEIKVKLNYLSLESGSASLVVENLDSGLVKRGQKSKIEQQQVKKAKNPLNWFGVLVPNSLRQSQKHFMKSTELAVEATNLQNEIGAIIARQQYLARQLKKA